MANSRVASRYVKALLNLAVEKNALEQVHSDMQLFDDACKKNRELLTMLRSPVIRHEKKREILGKIFKGKVDALSLAMMDIITRKNREPLLPAIAEEFHSAYNMYKGIEKASITTTVAMDKTLRHEVEMLVKKIGNKKLIELDEQVDKDLIGGFVLNVGDKQIDASIKSKLKALKLKFSENPYIREF